MKTTEVLLTMSGNMILADLVVGLEVRKVKNKWEQTKMYGLLTKFSEVKNFLFYSVFKSSK